VLPAQVRQLSVASHPGRAQQVGAAIQTGHVRLRVERGQPSGLESDAAACVKDVHAGPDVQGAAHRGVDRSDARELVDVLEEARQGVRDAAGWLAEGVVQVGRAHGAANLAAPL
jgi:hypothetical protein